MFYFARPDDPFNLCDTSPSDWYVDPASAGTIPDQLKTSKASFDLMNKKAAYKDTRLNVVIKLADTPPNSDIKSPMINIKIRPSNRAVFEVPQEIVDVQTNLGTCTGDNCALDKYLTVNTEEAPQQLITVSNGNGNDIWKLESLIQDQYINVIKSQVLTKTKEEFVGIIGLAERTVDSLRGLPTGVYSLWSRDSPNDVERGEFPGANIYGTHPFYMYYDQSGTSSWVGVYTNLAAAQDWYVTNNDDTGTIDLKTMAAGGIVDVTIMMGADPNEVTQRYHDLIGKPVLTPMWALGWH